MPRKRNLVGGSSIQARKRKAARALETDEQREQRLEPLRQARALARLVESPEKRELRLETSRKAFARWAEYKKQKTKLNANRIRAAQACSSELHQKRELRLAENRARQAQVRLSESPQKRELRLAALRARYAQARLTESSQERELRLQAQRAYCIRARVRARHLRFVSHPKRKPRVNVNRISAVQVRSPETPDERELRLAKIRARYAQARLSESPQKRELRLAALRARYAKARLNESPQKREMRLKARRERARIRASELRQKRELKVEHSDDTLLSETNEYSDERLSIHPECMAQLHSCVTPEQQQLKVEADLIRTTQVCSFESLEQRELKLEFEEDDIAHTLLLEPTEHTDKKVKADPMAQSVSSEPHEHQQINVEVNESQVHDAQSPAPQTNEEGKSEFAQLFVIHGHFLEQID